MTTGSSTGVSSGGQTGTSSATGVTAGGTNGSAGTKEATSAGGLSGGWIALIAALAVLAVAALVAAAFVFGRVRAGGAAMRGSTAAIGPVTTDAGTGGAASVAAASKAFCAECGSSVEPGARFCASCGRPL